MSILTKVLIGLVIVAVFPVMYLSASVLNVQYEWHKKVREFQAAVDKHEKEYQLLLHGDFDAQTHAIVPGKPIVGNPGVLQWQTARDNIMRGIGRVWYAMPKQDSVSVDAGMLTLQVLNDKVNDDVGGRVLVNHGMVDKAFLYVFEMSHGGDFSPGNDYYVGEFVVSGLPPGSTTNEVPIKPALPLSTAQWDKLKTSAGAKQWVVYDKMPADSRDVFVGLDDGEIRALFTSLGGTVPNDPEFVKRMQAAAEEYIYDNQPPSDDIKNNPALAEFIVTDPTTKQPRFLRPLRDYQSTFQAAAARLTEMNDRIQVLNKEYAYALQAEKNMVEKTIPALDKRKTRLAQELALVEAELKVVRDVDAKLTASIDQARQAVKQAVEENRRLLQEAAAGGKLTGDVPAVAPLAAAR